MSWSRRRVLQAGGMLAGMSAAAFWPRTSKRRCIALLNLHTGERLQIEYFRDAAYLPDALAAIDHLSRDFRTGEQHAIDTRLIDYLVEVAGNAGAPPEFGVISGYRSSSGVSKNTLHAQGRAIDVRLPEVTCADLRLRAQFTARGSWLLPRLGFRAPGYRQFSHLARLV